MTWGKRQTRLNRNRKTCVDCGGPVGWFASTQSGSPQYGCDACHAAMVRQAENQAQATAQELGWTKKGSNRETHQQK